MLSTDNVAIVTSSTGFAPNMYASVGTEIMFVTAVSGNVLTVTRNCDSTTAAQEAAGSVIAGYLVAGHHNTVKNELEAIEAALGLNLHNITWSTIQGTRQGNTNVPQMAGTNSGVTGATLCDDASGNATTSGCISGGGGVPFLVVGTYNFTPQTPGGNLSIGSNTITLTPCPLGVNGADLGHYLYVSGGTGAAEAGLITGGTCTSGLSSGTIIASMAGTHTGAWTIQSATSGIQEAANINTSSMVYIKSGNYPLYATVTVNGTIAFEGDGFNSYIYTTGTNYCAFTSTGNGDVWESMTLSSASPQIAGGCGIKLTSSGSNEFARVSYVNFTNLYNCLYALNAGAWYVDRNSFQNFVNAGVVVGDASTPDNGGPSIIGNIFVTYSLSSPAFAAIALQSTGGIRIVGNAIGGDLTQLDYGIFSTSTLSSGVIIDGNDIENTGLAGIGFSGTYSRVTVSNNTISNFGGDPGTWEGILFGSSSTVGLVSITGNAIQGSTASGNTCIQLQSAGNGYAVTGNQLSTCGTGIYTIASTGAITLGNNQMYSVTTPLSVNSTTLLALTTPVTYAQLVTLAPAPGSVMSTSDTGCAGSGSPTTCVWSGSAWAH
jgi:hypothetical protein